MNALVGIMSLARILISMLCALSQKKVSVTEIVRLQYLILSDLLCR